MMNSDIMILIKYGVYTLQEGFKTHVIAHDTPACLTIRFFYKTI